MGIFKDKNAVTINLPDKRSRMISKSRFLAASQCLKRFYLAVFSPEFGVVDATTKSTFETGHKIGNLARELFLPGHLIEAGPLEGSRAEAETKTLLGSESVTNIFEAAFQFDGLHARIDILKKNPDGSISIFEVKSAASVKPHFILDAAFQYYILIKLGCRVSSVNLVILNTEYAYQGGNYDLDRLFKIEPITSECVSLQDSIRDAVGAAKNVLLGSTPDIATGRHCTKPYKCEFRKHCSPNTEFPVTLLPKLTDNQKRELANLGITEIRDILSDRVHLTPKQKMIVETTRSGIAYCNPIVAETLKSLKFPLYFLDFESINPALPVYPITHPYEVIAVQWSIHRLDADGGVRHFEFLADDDEDPRRELASQLVEALGDVGTILTYSNFEMSRLQDLQRLATDLHEKIENLKMRIFDLLPLIREYFYHPGMKGSYSIKDVIGSLNIGAGYKGLEIDRGYAAAQAFGCLLDAKVEKSEKKKIRSQLLAYCKRDTEVMVDLYSYLTRMK